MEKRIDYKIKSCDLPVEIVYYHYNKEKGDRFSPPSYGYAEVEQILVNGIDILDILNDYTVIEIEEFLAELIQEER